MEVIIIRYKLVITGSVYSANKSHQYIKRVNERHLFKNKRKLNEFLEKQFVQLKYQGFMIIFDFKGISFAARRESRITFVHLPTVRRHLSGVGEEG